MNAHTEAQFAAIHAAEAQCNTTLAALRERVSDAAEASVIAEFFNTDAARANSAYDAACEAERVGAAEAFARRDAVIAANGGPIDPIAYLLAIGRDL